MDWLKDIEERLKIMAALPPAPGEGPSAADMLAADARKLIAAARLAEGVLARADKYLLEGQASQACMLIEGALPRLRSGEVEQENDMKKKPGNRHLPGYGGW